MKAHKELAGRTSIVTGVTGQDGCYLSQSLLRLGYRVVGVVSPNRNSSLVPLQRLGVLGRLNIVQCDLNSFTETQNLVLRYQPDEIYHLAAQSSVAESYRSPTATMQVNTVPISNLLEVVRVAAPQSRLYHASSSEMYGQVKELPITEVTAFHPISPYAVSKVAAHQLVSCYRESYGIFAVSGVMFNHESVLRRENFFTQKLIRGARELKVGARKSLTFGNLDVRRDIGYAPKYVEAMWLMLQANVPYDYLICSGGSVSLRDLVRYVFERLGVSLDAISVDPSLIRPNEIPDIYGSNVRAREELGWEYDMNAFDVMDRLLAETGGVSGQPSEQITV